MKLTLSLILLVILMASSILPLQAQDKSEWEENLDVLITELPAQHVNPFTHISEADFMASAESLRAELPNLSDEQILMRMAALVASLGDSHTTLLWGLPDPIFPIQLAVFEDGFYAIAIHQDAAVALGARLVGINGQPIEAVIEQVKTVIPHENDLWLNAQLPNFLIQSKVLLGLGIIDHTDAVAWEFETPAGETVSVDVSSIARSEMDFSVFGLLRTTTPPTEIVSGFYNLNLFEDGTLYFKYNSATDATDLPMSEFIDLLLDALANQPVERLVIDLRENTGGNSALIDPLITALKDLPINTAGKLFVIIGERTFSSGMFNALRLANETEAVLIGQPTGGSPNHFGEVRSFELPHFGLAVNYSTNYFELMPGQEGKTLMPDILVPRTLEDYIAGIDPFYAAVLAYQP